MLNKNCSKILINSFKGNLFGMMKIKMKANHKFYSINQKISMDALQNLFKSRDVIKEMKVYDFERTEIIIDSIDNDFEELIFKILEKDETMILFSIKTAIMYKKDILSNKIFEIYKEHLTNRIPEILLVAVEYSSHTIVKQLVRHKLDEEIINKSLNKISERLDYEMLKIFLPLIDVESKLIQAVKKGNLLLSKMLTEMGN